MDRQDRSRYVKLLVLSIHVIAHQLDLGLGRLPLTLFGKLPGVPVGIHLDQAKGNESLAGCLGGLAPGDAPCLARRKVPFLEVAANQCLDALQDGFRGALSAQVEEDFQYGKLELPIRRRAGGTAGTV